METEVTNGLIPRKFNQALMELGAMVCVPNGAPHCPECPWYGFCEARLQDKIDTIPVKTRAKARRIEERTVFVIRDGEHVALRKRPAKGLLAGLYELPNVSGILEQQEALEYVKNQGFHRYGYRHLHRPDTFFPCGVAYACLCGSRRRNYGTKRKYFIY